MSNRQKMKAVGAYRYLPLSDPESLVDLHIEKPAPTGRDLLVEVKAVSVNPADLDIREKNNYEAESPKILGWDVAGIVEQVGPECQLFKPGDEIFYAGSVARAGGNSEFHLVDERIAGNKPKSLDFAQAAALPLTSLTAWEGLFDRLGISHSVEENESILIIGAAGGVGSIATQLAKLAGLTVIGTASRPESVQWAKEHGADFTINHNSPFAPQLKEIGFETVDYIFCLNDTVQHFANMAEVIAPQGKICSIVPVAKSSQAGSLDMDLLFSKSVTFVWELMFTRSMYQTKDMIKQHDILNQLAELIDNGKLKTTLAERLEPINAANLRLVHEKMETGRSIGKIVLENF
ncbi:zinc-binding alcohol dehydrogenase family protein [Paenibacillus sophorae]|uniref:Zinc-type alcohol dehydrogenase-like protein n=1 Tax=Paenibacillus sophorae TaxID=1333845 RepID=A0A1H8SBR4_9BACL|nr:zinc-binding alcohol dehydrogenase family protein [Paenibacillus sophorae]QWU16800.1 zinc-binding alcohol dehydrogenase family protein [Paenibacillus sophorae]SEO75794.1 zinc-binding alcohol dehydrogenase family protein [Paenibacillus sophorae]